MTITVKQIVVDIIDNIPNKSEIEVDNLIEIKNNEIDRVDIIRALQEMEKEELGVFIKGRRGKKSRFVKGMVRTFTPISEESLSLLKEEVSQLNQGDVMLASLSYCKKNASEEQLTELKEFEDKADASKFFNDNILKAIDALKILETKNFGTFIIGRRGKFSRFIKGISKDELQNRPKGLAVSEEKIIKYSIISNVILRTFDEGQFDNLHDAMVTLNVDDVDAVQKSIKVLGYYIAKDNS